MASITLKNVYKIYPGGVQAVTDFNLEIEDKEFVVFVGPSGCGKSTILRMIAGLESITKGEIYIDGKLINDVEPKDRDIAMVFQNYALYPHMTVYQNMAFGLKLRHIPKKEIEEKVCNAAKILGLEDYLERKPKNLSGGQRQRVALGRAIVRDPKVFLLDEPLSNLDAKMRTQMRTEINKLHKDLNTTFVYVTHDQVEAMTMGTKIVVMKDGIVQQVDNPYNLYEYPVNKFVAGFIGTPQMNFIDITILQKENDVVAKFGKNEIVLPESVLKRIQSDDYIGKEFALGIRAEDIIIDEKKVKANHGISFPATIKVVEQLGNETLIYFTVDGKDDNLICRTNIRKLWVLNEQMDIAFDIKRIHLFDKETEKNILARE